MRNEQWILCPICGCKTELKIQEDTVLKNFPLYFPKCKHETLIKIQQLNMSVIKEPDAEPITRKASPCGYGLSFISQYAPLTCPFSA